MKKVIAAMNMTLDGFCDHTSGLPDEEIHTHYAALLCTADAALYGRITYQLMEYWRTVLDQPVTDETMNDFARAIDATPKIVFTRTLNAVDWPTAKIAVRSLAEEIVALRSSPVLDEKRSDIFVCSPSLIVQLSNLKLIDEYQICIHPVIAGGGLPLFKAIQERMLLKLQKTKTFRGGAMLLYYSPAGQKD